MTDRDFLLTIIENPKEDGPRLVYADYLEETGRCERAEYIRVQCELVRLEATEPCLKYGTYGCAQFICEGKCRPCQKKYPLKVREAELRDKNINEWFWGSLPVIQFCSIGWSRGFLCEVSLTESDFLKCATQLCWHPIEKVTLTDREPSPSTKLPEYFWFRSFTNPIHRNAMLRDELFETVLVMGKKSVLDPAWSVYFPSKEKAASALQEGCLSYLNSLRTPESCIPSDVTIQQLRPEEQPLDA